MPCYSICKTCLFFVTAVIVEQYAFLQLLCYWSCSYCSAHVSVTALSLSRAYIFVTIVIVVYSIYFCHCSFKVDVVKSAVGPLKVSVPLHLYCFSCEYVTLLCNHFFPSPL